VRLGIALSLFVACAAQARAADANALIVEGGAPVTDFAKFKKWVILCINKSDAVINYMHALCNYQNKTSKGADACLKADAFKTISLELFGGCLVTSGFAPHSFAFKARGAESSPKP
jgi:hypothetical protein